jgi:F-type H+-transporting ATPase subunit b
MGNLIDIRQVLTQILGFLILLWGLRKFAWGPVLGMLEARRRKIAGEFDLAAKKQSEAEQLKGRYEHELRTIDAQARQKIQDAVVEGQRVAAEIKARANRDAADRLAHAADDIAREREKAKELLKEQVIHLSLRSAEKILRQKLDDTAQRKLVSEFIDEVGAIR